jgi:hypothetical protein
MHSNIRCFLFTPYCCPNRCCCCHQDEELHELLEQLRGKYKTVLAGLGLNAAGYGSSSSSAGTGSGTSSSAAAAGAGQQPVSLAF